ncbi:lipopolysaccharide-induced tumor necrosis factor-alpha factor homolog [Brevipalpus obovatus]|uniref:lipopolysaccharide-induced tumor necrosis factor-alpha factor homolog n=1 Tax=Brevipalpus obovatus TaxID=246614 RepID=UPI003D9E1A1E
MSSDYPPPAYSMASQSQFASTTNPQYPSLASGDSMDKSNQGFTFGDQPQQPQVNATVIAAAATQVNYGPYPVLVACPGCNQQVNTNTELKTGIATWLSCMGCCVLGCFLCWCFPFCMNCTKDVIHECPHCNRKLGIFKRI